MFKSRWWVDLRFEQERRMVLTVVIVLAVAAVLVAWLGWSTSERLKEPVDSADEAGPAQVGPTLEPGSLPVAETTETLDRVAELVKAGRLFEATLELRDARRKAPNDLYIENRYLLMRVQVGETAEVEREVQTALELSPQNSLGRIAMAAAALELAEGRFSNAADFLFSARATLPAATFQSLLAEPPLSAHAARPELAPFYPRAAPDPAAGD